MKMDIVKELSSNQIILIVMQSQNYHAQVLDIAKRLSRSKMLYVTLNKTYEGTADSFKKKKINPDSVIFIDGMSRSIKKVGGTAKNVQFISSPGALTELSLAITKLLNKGIDYIVIDSVTNILTYSDKSSVLKFLSSLSNKVRGSQTKLVLFALDLKEHESAIKQYSMSVDSTINLK